MANSNVAHKTIYANSPELGGKYYDSYSRAVLAALEHGYELVSNIDETSDGQPDPNSKAVFRRAAQGGGLFDLPTLHGYISPIQVVCDSDEIGGAL